MEEYLVAMLAGFLILSTTSTVLLTGLGLLVVFSMARERLSRIKGERK